jgi:hypothetical protein
MSKIDFQKISNRVKIIGDVPIISENEINNVQEKLNIKLSNDFLQLASFGSYEFIGGIDFYNFGLENNNSVIYETLLLRSNINLPNNFLILFQDESSLILLEIYSIDNCRVIWCCFEDVSNIIENKSLCYEHNIFSDFFSFYDYLLDEHEINF